MHPVLADGLVNPLAQDCALCGAVCALPDVVILVRALFHVSKALTLKDGRKLRVVAPVDLGDFHPGIFGLAETLLYCGSLTGRVPCHPQFSVPPSTLLTERRYQDR